MAMPKKIVRRDVAARQANWARRLAASLAGAGVRPNTISILSVAFAAAAGACLVFSRSMGTGGGIALLIAALLLIQLRLVCNLMDGMVAVEGGLKTASGEVFNDFPDRIADPIILVCAGYAVRDVSFAVALGWTAGMLAVLTAYVRVLGGATGAGQFFLGPMAKQHRMALMSAALVVAVVLRARAWDAAVITVALALIVVGCLITIARRVRRIVTELESR